jgi:PAS domain S-box-containing protein/putative nucleotidyltransferase with HDIG domain
VVLAGGVALSGFLAWAIRPSDEAHVHDAAAAWATLVLGLAGTGLAVALLLSWKSAEVRAERIADDLVADLRAKDIALRSSEARWQFAVDGSGDGLWDWDVTGGTVWFSRRWKTMLGFDETEIGHSLDEWSRRVHPDDLDEVMACIDAYLRGESDHYECVHRVERKDGTYLWVLDRGMAVERDGDGRPTRMIGTHKDVSEQQRLEADLRGRTSDLEQAQRLAKMGSWVLDVTTGGVEWSAPLYDMFALPADQPPPDYDHQRSLFTLESWDRLNAAVIACVQRGAPYELELEAITFTGVPRWMLARGIPVRDDDGRVVQVRGIAMDVTDRHWAAGRIAHLTQLYKALSQCNAAQVHAADEADLFQRVCDVMVRHNGVQLAWLGVVETSSGRIVPAAVAGDGVEYVAGIDIRVDPDDPRGQGPAGTSARTGRPVWIDDFDHDPRMQPWRERGTTFGWEAVGSLPIRHHGVTVAVLNLYFTDSDLLDGETRGLLSSMADDISFSVERLRTAAQLEESEQRFRSLVEQSIAGAYIVQDRRLAYVNPRFKEILGYDPDDDLVGVDVETLFAADEVEPAIERERRVLAGEVPSVESVFRARRKDGSLANVGTHSSLAMYHQRPAMIGLMQDLSDRRVAEAQIERYVDQLESVLFQTVGVITDLSSMRDPYTSNHERNVASLAVEIGRRLDLDADRLEGLRVGGLLHDVGKIAIPTEILVKPTRLSSLELSLVREHPRIGYELLRGIDFPWPVARVAHEHHERVDGTGYPRGLIGDQICLEARIVAVADVVDSMSSHRPYRASLGTDAALDEIERNAGTFYDAEVVAACAGLIRDGGYRPGNDG